VKPPLALLAALYAAMCMLVLPASLDAATGPPIQPGAKGTTSTSPTPAPPKDPQSSPPTQQGPKQAAEPTGTQTSTGPSRPAPRPSARAAGSGSVTIHDFAFSPSSLTVHVGDRATWFNQGPSSHSATANDGSFDTGVLAKGTSGSFTFSTPGTFSYHCTPHPFMHGSITVLAASTGPTKGGNAGKSPAGKGSATGGSSASRAGGGAAPAGLPKTGFDVAVVAGLGLVLLGVGSFLRRRAALRS
jgi:LPXTG-motif cell wall-anchored protein